MKTMKKIVALMAVVLMLCSILPLSVAAADTYELATSIEVGDTVVLAVKSSKMELNSISTTNTKYGIGVAYTDAPAGAYALTVEEGSTAGTYSFKCPNGQYLYWTSGNSLATNAAKSANTSWKVSFSGDNAVITNAKDSSRKLQWNASSPRFACYTSAQTAVQLYKLSGGETACEHPGAEYDYDCVEGYCPDCETVLPAKVEHDYVEDIIDATCTQTGTATYECSVCGHSYDEEIAMIPHNYGDGNICITCGEEKPAFATITFDANKTQRTEYSTATQKWENEGLVLINNKAGSTSNVGDYSNPGRFYKSSTIIISFPGMTSLVIDAPSGQYATPWADTLTAAGLSYEVDGGVYTITFAEPTDNITLTASAQIRANSITAYGSSKPACEHEYDNDCDVDCNLCYETREVEHNVSHVEAVAPTYEAMGNIEYWYCDACGQAWLDAECTLNTNLMAVKLPQRELPVSFGGNSASEDVSGLAFRFDVTVDGMDVNGTTAIYDNATVDGYKLITMGAIVSNSKSELDIPAVYLCDLEADSASYAVRVINIPEANFGDEITAVPYFVVEIDGVETTVYGEAQVASYNGALNG